MLNAYLTEDEFCRKYSSYQKGQTVTLRIPFYCNKGKYEVGTEFVIVDVELRIDLPNVFSSEADNYYADDRMFLYTVRPKESDYDFHILEIEYFRKCKFTEREFLVNIVCFTTMIVCMIGLVITIVLKKEAYSPFFLCGGIISTLVGYFSSFLKPRLHKKRK